MCKLLSDQMIELETRGLPLLIEPNTSGVHQDRPQETIAQMPQIASPDTLEQAPVGELPKDRVHPIAHPARYRTLVCSRLRRVCDAVGSLQNSALCAQTGLDARHPIRSVTQDQPLRSFQPDGSQFPIGFIGRSQMSIKSSRLMASLLSKIACHTEDSESHEPFFVQGNLHMALTKRLTDFAFKDGNFHSRVEFNALPSVEDNSLYLGGLPEPEYTGFSPFAPMFPPVRPKKTPAFR